MSFHVLVKIRKDVVENGAKTHHPSCSPICNEQIRATEIHRSCKLLAKEGVATASVAFEQAVKLAEAEGRPILAQLGTWMQVRSAYFDAAAQGKNCLRRLNV
ncbi:hypothetical protein AAVH_19989 [Aphelenchoides avenae]|nr:hypothetical protein AAVH_19989 [Aphelenchus avenae]